jgi:ribosome-associated protein YbcJ (S4-like RNA binding protein)
VTVNGQVETRRGRKLHEGDVVVVEGEELVVQVTEGETDAGGGEAGAA